MWVTPAFAQDAAPAASTGTLFSLLPFLLIFVIMYFLLIRPQQRKAKQHLEMIRAVRRGDMITTNGGLIGKVTKVIDDGEVEIELGPNTKVRLVRSAIADVRAKGEPVKDEA